MTVLTARWATAYVAILSVALAPTAGADEHPSYPPPIYPVALQPGDTIAFVAPAGLLERPRMELAKRRLEALGFVVKVPNDLFRSRGYLAGEDQRRADELMAAFRDPEVDAVFPGTGGYGATRMLHLIDYDVIRENPKVFIGFSDITALHLAIRKKTGLITFHSPVPMWGLGSKENLHPFAEKYFWRALLRSEYFDSQGRALPTGYSYSTPANGPWAAGLQDATDGLPARTGTGSKPPVARAPQIKAIVPGVGRGRLIGGNLSLIVALMGTEFEIDTDGAVLFLEDVGERPYRIDRCLSQLRLAGKFDHVAGVILGQFSDCKPEKDKPSLTLEQVFDDYFGKLAVPVIGNFPAGHSRYNATLPLGALVEVDANAGRMTVLENPVRLETSD